MQEFYDKYKTFKRIPTHPTIDHPVIVFAGCTLEELLGGCCLFVMFAMFLDQPLLGLFAGVATAIVCKKYRTQFPRGYTLHALWRKGLLQKNGIPKLVRPFQNTLVFGPGSVL